MHLKRIWIAALMLSIGFIGASRAMADKLSSEDKDMIKNAMRNLEAGIQDARLARSNADSEGVKHFAEMVAVAHNKMIKDLRELGDKYDFSYDNDPSKPDVRTKKELERLKGKEFDRVYMSNAAREHEEMVDDWKKGAKDAHNRDLRDWFEKTQDSIREHRDNAKELYRKVKDKD